jgi:hypothetical protein
MFCKESFGYGFVAGYIAWFWSYLILVSLEDWWKRKWGKELKTKEN